LSKPICSSVFPAISFVVSKFLALSTLR
jgi:hypothetical protein